MRWWRLSLVVFAATSVKAQEIVDFRVDYAAPDQCPDATQFTALVTGRTERAKPSQAPGAVRVEVRIETAAGNDGRVKVTGSGREPIERSVRGASCAEIVDALALITALQLDPEASSEVRREEPPPAKPTPPSPPAPPPKARVKDDGLVWSFDAALGLIPFDSTLPGPDLGFAASAGASSEGRLFAPEAFVYARRTTGDVGRGEGRGEFSILAFGVLGCPVRTPARGQLAFRPCAGFELGALSAAGVGLVLEKKETTLWIAPLVAVRGEWQFTPTFFASGTLGVRFPLLRQHYFFESGENVHDIPRVSVGFDLGIGVRLR
jgi:hypothetical protein